MLLERCTVLRTSRCMQFKFFVLKLSMKVRKENLSLLYLDIKTVSEGCYSNILHTWSKNCKVYEFNQHSLDYFFGDLLFCSGSPGSRPYHYTKLLAGLEVTLESNTLIIPLMVVLPRWSEERTKMIFSNQRYALMNSSIYQRALFSTTLKLCCLKKKKII